MYNGNNNNNKKKRIPKSIFKFAIAFSPNFNHDSFSLIFSHVIHACSNLKYNKINILYLINKNEIFTFYKEFDFLIFLSFLYILQYFLCLHEKIM